MKYTIFIAVLFAFGCKKESAQTPAPQTKIEVENANLKNTEFELLAAADWTFVPQKGMDSYVGYYLKGDDTIRFDHGTFSFKNLDDIRENSSMFYFESVKINGIDAKIVGEENYLTAYIYKDNRNKTKLYSTNYSKQDDIITVFKSHKFKSFNNF